MDEQLELIQLMLDDLRFRNPSSFFFENLTINDAKRDDVLKLKATLEEIERKLQLLVNDKYPGDSAAIAVMAEQVESLFNLQCENASSTNNSIEDLTINNITIDGNSLDLLLQNALQLSQSLDTGSSSNNQDLETDPFFFLCDEGSVYGITALIFVDGRINRWSLRLSQTNENLFKHYLLFLIPKTYHLSVLHQVNYNQNDKSFDYHYGALNLETKKAIRLGYADSMLFGIRITTGNNCVVSSLISYGSNQSFYDYNPKGLQNEIKSIDQFGYVATFKGYDSPCAVFVQAWESKSYSNIYAQVISKQVINGDTIVKIMVHGVKTTHSYQRVGRTTCNLSVVLIGDGEDLTNNLRKATGNDSIQVGIYSNLGNEYFYHSYPLLNLNDPELVKNTLSPWFVGLGNNRKKEAFVLAQSHRHLHYIDVTDRSTEYFTYNMRQLDSGQIQPEHVAKNSPISCLLIQGLKD